MNYVASAVKIILITVLVRFNSVERYYPGLAQARQVREQRQAVTLQAPYRQQYLQPNPIPIIYLNNGPVFIYNRSTYGIIVK